jgi:hypothetical protein
MLVARVLVKPSAKALGVSYLFQTSFLEYSQNIISKQYIKPSPRPQEKETRKKYRRLLNFKFLSIVYIKKLYCKAIRIRNRNLKRPITNTKLQPPSSFLVDHPTHHHTFGENTRQNTVTKTRKRTKSADQDPSRNQRPVTNGMTSNDSNMDTDDPRPQQSDTDTSQSDRETNLNVAEVNHMEALSNQTSEEPDQIPTIRKRPKAPLTKVGWAPSVLGHEKIIQISAQFFDVNPQKIKAILQPFRPEDDDIQAFSYGIYLTTRPPADVKLPKTIEVPIDRSKTHIYFFKPNLKDLPSGITTLHHPSCTTITTLRIKAFLKRFNLKPTQWLFWPLSDKETFIKLYFPDQKTLETAVKKTKDGIPISGYRPSPGLKQITRRQTNASTSKRSRDQENE